jgi:hypothetical protein
MTDSGSQGNDQGTIRTVCPLGASSLELDIGSSGGAWLGPTGAMAGHQKGFCGLPSNI